MLGNPCKQRFLNSFHYLIKSAFIPTWDYEAVMYGDDLNVGVHGPCHDRLGTEGIHRLQYDANASKELDAWIGALDSV